MAGGERRRPQWARSLSLGTELAAAVGGFTLLGYWIDRHFDTAPWALLICFALGLVGGLYNFIRASLQAWRESASGGGGGDDERRPGAAP